MEDFELLRNQKRLWLKRYSQQMRHIEMLENKLARLEDRLMSVKSPNYSGMPRGGTPVTTEDLIADKEELQERLKRSKCKAKNLRKEIIDVIDCLNNILQLEILERRYIKLQSFEYIAEDMGYHERHITRVCTSAIDNIAIPGIA